MYILNRIYTVNIQKDTIEFYNLSNNKFETLKKDTMKQHNKYYEVLTHSY
jgi:hypothetical protein